MKALSLILTVFMTFSAWASPEEKSLTIYELTKTMSEKRAEEIPQRFKNLLVQDLHISGPFIAFKIKNFPIHIELVKTEKVALKLNGVAFAPQDFRSTEILEKQIIKKFNLKRKRFSLLDLFISKAHAKRYVVDLSDSLAASMRANGHTLQACENCGRQTYPDMASLMAALGTAQGSGFMPMFLAASNEYRHPFMQQPTNIPTLTPFRISVKK